MTHASSQQRPNPYLLFGSLAVQHGFATPDQVETCVRVQQDRRQRDGFAPSIGDLLVEQGVLTREQADEIFRIQGREGGHRQLKGYELTEKIGKGAMGTVYKAVQVSMERTVAIKVLAPRLARNEKFVRRFVREARASAKLNHPNIITGIDVGETNGIYYFAMEFVDGHSVQHLLKRGGALDEKRALGIALQVARALEHAARHTIIHRDIKPANIMISGDGTAKLCDLGLARMTGDVGSSTETGIAIGTPNYISPEQARGRTNLDSRTDIYCLGATLYHMLTGETPYDGPAPKVLGRHCHDPVPEPRDVRPDLAARTAHLVKQMMAKDPDDRPQSPTDLIQAIELAIDRLSKAGEPRPSSHEAPPPRRPSSDGGPAERVPGSPGRRPASAVGGGNRLSARRRLNRRRRR